MTGHSVSQVPLYRYIVDSSRTEMLVQARSRIHDTTSKWDRIAGTVEADPETLAEAGARASFTVEMAAFDAGDWLKNKKLKSEIDAKKYPTATFELIGLRDVVKRDDGTFAATARGLLRYRGRELDVEIAGNGTMDETGIDARGTFDIDLRDFGMKPPRFLMFKMEPELTIEIFLRAAVSRP
jgi:polyisoprenoid-binding protein YceI